MSDLGDRRDRDKSSEYMADLRSSIWKSVKEDRARLLQDMEQHRSSHAGQSGDPYDSNFDLNTLRSRSAVLREDSPSERNQNKSSRGMSQVSVGGATYRIESSEMLNNSRPRTSSQSSSGNISDVRQINQTRHASKSVPQNTAMTSTHGRGQKYHNGEISRENTGENETLLKLPEVSFPAKDTPRTQQLKDLRSKRLAYFEKHLDKPAAGKGGGKEQKKSPRRRTPRSLSPRKPESAASSDVRLHFDAFDEKVEHTNAFIVSDPQRVTTDKSKRVSYEHVNDVTSLIGESSPPREPTDLHSGRDVGISMEASSPELNVDPVVDLLGLQKALQHGDEGLRQYLLDMGRKSETSQSRHPTDQRKPDKHIRTNVRDHIVDSPRENAPNSFDTASSKTSPDSLRDLTPPKAHTKRNDGFPMTQNIWEERVHRESPRSRISGQPGKPKETNLSEHKSKIGSPSVTSTELQNLGLYEDLFVQSREEERLNNEMTNLKSSLMRSGPPFKRNYDRGDPQPSVYLTEVPQNSDSAGRQSGSERTRKQRNVGRNFSEGTCSESDSVGSADGDGYHQVQNRWKTHEGIDSNGSDIELETHRPDIRPVSPLKEVKSNVKVKVSDHHQCYGAEWEIPNASSMISPKLPTPKKPEDVPNLMLEPSSSSEESDHLEFMDFPKKKRTKKKQALADSLSDFTNITELNRDKVKLSKQKKRVMKSELSLRLSLDSTVSGGSEFVDSEAMSEFKDSNVKLGSQKVLRSVGDQLSYGQSVTKTRVKKPQINKTESATKSTLSSKLTLDSVEPSSHKHIPVRSGDPTKTAGEPSQKFGSERVDLMNEMYDHWADAGSTTKATHNVFLNERIDGIESPRTDYFSGGPASDQKTKQQPTGRSAFSVEDFLTGILYQKSADSGTENQGMPGGKRETEREKPFARAETILRASSKSQSEKNLDMRQHNVEMYQLLEKNFSDVEKKLADLGLEHLLDESNDVSQSGDKKIKMVKICPECDAVNREHITWCLECGCVLIGVQSEPHPDVIRAIASNYANANGDVTCQAQGSPELNNNIHGKIAAEYKDLDVGKSNERQPQSSGQKSGISTKGLTEASQPPSSGNRVSDSESAEGLRRRDELGENPLTAYQQYLLHLERQQEQEAQQAASSVPEAKNVSFASPDDSARPEFGKSDGRSSGDVSDDSLGTEEDGQGTSPERVGSPARLENAVSVVSDSSDVPGDAAHPLFAMFLNDPRVRPGEAATSSSVSKPRPSSADPKTSVREKTPQPRPSSSGTKSRTRQYVEQDFYQRHWTRSSTAWDSYNENELSTWSSVDAGRKPSQRQRPLSAKKSSRNTPKNKSETTRSARPTSAGRYKSSNTQENSNNNNNSVDKSRPTSAKTKQKNGAQANGDQSSRPKSATGQRETGSQDKVKFFQVNSAQLSESNNRPLNSYGVSSVPPLTMKLLLESPRDIRSLSIWQVLPDEILLKIFTFLSHKDLVRCAQVCHLFDRIARDETLWRHISLEKKSLCDAWLEEIGKKCPTTLSLQQCRGAHVTSSGLRSLFRACSSSLEELNISGCSQGELVGDSILLHATRCPNLSVIDASWCNVSDSAVVALVDSSQRLESVCLNGCQAVTDEAVFALVNKHADSLQVLELFGCFNLTPESILMAGSFCKKLHTLNIGQCYKLTDECITQLATYLANIEYLDLRGCKQIKDDCVRKVVRKCGRLQSLVLANCPLITDNALVEIATYLSTIRSLDVSGCKKITNTGVSSIAMSCPNLILLDVSSTGINHRSVSAIASYCNKHLETLKLSFCSDITEASVIKLAKNCKNLHSLYLFGCKLVRNLHYLAALNPLMEVKTDVAVSRSFNYWDFSLS